MVAAKKTTRRMDLKLAIILMFIFCSIHTVIALSYYRFSEKLRQEGSGVLHESEISSRSKRNLFSVSNQPTTASPKEKTKQEATEVEPCPCENGGDCLRRTPTFCLCRFGYHGELCQFYIGASGEWPAVNCGQYFFGKTEGKITSPFYPDDYRNNHRCYYIIATPGAQTIKLTFNHLNIEKDFDYIVIGKGHQFDWPSRIYEVSGEFNISTIPEPIELDSAHVWIYFYSDFVNVDSGFQLTFMADVNACESNPCPSGSQCQDLKYSYQCKDITASGCSCLNGGSCIGKDSNGAEFCACPSGRQGDMCELTISPPSNCGENYYGEKQGQIVSPNYPMEYENRLNCYYHIGVPGAKTIRIIYNAIDVERNRDEFVIYSGSMDAVSNMRVLYTDSLAVMPAPLDIKGDRALIKFYTDVKGVRTGFNISFIADMDSCLSNPCTEGLECIDDDFAYECLKKPENTKETYKITEADEKLTTTGNKPLIPTTTPVFLVPTPVPAVGYCTVWSQKYYRTFDGKHFIFDSTCSLILATDCQDLGLFSIYLSTEQCEEKACNQRLTIELDTDNGMMTLQLRKVGEQAVVVVNYNVGEFLTESSTVNGVEVLFVSGWVVVSSSIGFNVIWDGMSRYTVDITSEELYGGLCGLCGNNNEDQEDDFSSPEGAKQLTAERFGRSWKTNDQKGSCYDESRRCTNSIGATAKTEYMSVCGKLRGGIFQSCNEKVDVTPFIDACKEYMCDCVLASGSDANKDVVMEECTCKAFSAYSSACAWQQEVVEWRTHENCPLQCPDGMEYQICGSTCPQTCGNQVVDCENDYCIEGCHCPAGQMLVDNLCIAPSECPCEFNGHQIQPGRVMRDGISECVCNDGKWDCFEYDSPGRCWLAGADHFKSFDGKHFDFTGDCEYVLVTNCPSLDNDFSVNVQNYGCSQFGTSCSRAVIIMIGTTRVRVRSTEILVNDEDVKKLPAEYNGVLIERPTTSAAKVTLSNGLQVEVTKDYRVTITAPPRLKHNLCGLCGTFNGNQEDDFYTKSGDIETTAQSFGSKWQTSAFCDTPAYHFNFCMLRQQHVSLAVEKCNVFRMVNGPFSECLSVLDSEAYCHACMSQVCGCKTSECSCTIIEQYAVDCSSKGIVLEWRDSIPVCAVACEGDLVYHDCASTCGSSCASLSSGFPCHPGCVPGCACPEGKVLDQDGSCVVPSECPCPSDNGLVSPGFVYESPCGPCECINGSFTCEKEMCSDECGNHMAFSTCKPSQSKTCANMESHMEQLPGQCVPGCVCQDGFVFDENIMECVAPDNCPCQHGGNLYKKGEDIMIGCNKCTCMGTSWECEEKECPGICTAWGDPHFTSFDGKRFDLHGDCDYELATNHYNKQDDGHEPFRIVIKNVPCGVAGVTCTKSVKLTIGSGRDKDKVHLVRGKPIHVTSRNPDRIHVSEVGLYVFVHTNIGVTLIWDKGTWVQVKLDPYYKGQVSGLCGNYNNNQNDDFTKRSGMPAISAMEFGYSWRLHNYCVESEVVQSACSLYPARELWARRKCAILKSDVFRPCHSVVSPDVYIQQCVNDACNCNGGTGCEKLCTAISAYAHQCSAMKVSISWRNQNLCPIQCLGCQEYKPCIGICSTCENKFRLISQDDGSDECPDTCVEGCACPEGKVMQNGECVDRCDALPTQSSFQEITEEMVSLATKPQVSDGKSSPSDKCKSTCEKMYGDVFRPCHTTQSPILFYEICKQPAFLCNECMVLERYAQLCSVFGVVLDWRASSMCEEEDKDNTTNSELLLSAVTRLMTTQLPTTQASSTTTVQAHTVDVKAPTTTQSEMPTTFAHTPTTTSLAPSTTNRAPLATAQTQPATTQASINSTQRPSGATPESTTHKPLISKSISTTSPQAVSFLGTTTITETPFVTTSGSTATVRIFLATNPESTATTQASLPNASKSPTTQLQSTASSEPLTATTRRESSETAPYFTDITQSSSANTAGSTLSSQASLATNLRSSSNIQAQSSTTSTHPLSTATSESSAFDQLLLATTLVSTNTSREPLVTTPQSSATLRSAFTTTWSSSARTVESITSSQTESSSAATPFSSSNSKTSATTLESISSSQVTSGTTVESTTSSQASSATTSKSTTTTTGAPSSSATTVESSAFSQASSAVNPISTTNTKSSATTLESTTSLASSGTTAGPNTSFQEFLSPTTLSSTNNTQLPSSTASTSQSANSDQLPLGTTVQAANTLGSTTTNSQSLSAATALDTATTFKASSSARSTPNTSEPSSTTLWSVTNLQTSATTLDSTNSFRASSGPNSQAPSGTTDRSTTSSKESLTTIPISTTNTLSTITQAPSTTTSESPHDRVTTMPPLTTTVQGLSVSTTNLESTTVSQKIVESITSTQASSAKTLKSTINTQTPLSTTSWSSTFPQPASFASSESSTSDQVSLKSTAALTTTTQTLPMNTQASSETYSRSATTTESSSAITLKSANSTHTSFESTLMSTTGASATLSATLLSTTSQIPSVTTWSSTSRDASSETTPTPTTQASSATIAESTISSQALSETTSESPTTTKSTTSCPDYCSEVYNTVFEDCHQFINPELYYLMCRAEHSMCSDCLILEAYASRCTQFGLNIQWRYGNCELTTAAPTNSVPIVKTSPFEECPNLCSELYSDRFKPCHAIMNPDFFYASCQTAHASCTECSVLSTYAQICQNLGHCIEWTSDGLCAVDCPSGQEYRECVCRDQEHCGSKVTCHAAMMVSECTCPQGFELVSGECQPCATSTPTLTPTITTTTTATTTEFVCPTSIISQCEHVMTDAFKPCHGFVDPEEFVQECKAACSNTCDLLESYANTCQILHGICLAWRSENICPVSCGSLFSYGGPVDLIYKQCVCPKQSCVEDNRSCFSSQLVSECMCPDGMQVSGNVKEGGSCIACSKSETCGIVTKVSEVKLDLDGLTCTAEVKSSQCSGRCASGTGTVANIFDSLLQITLIRETCNAEEVEKVEQTLRCFDGREKTIIIENAVTCACGNACQ